MSWKESAFSIPWELSSLMTGHETNTLTLCAIKVVACYLLVLLIMSYCGHSHSVCDPGGVVYRPTYVSNIFDKVTTWWCSCENSACLISLHAAILCYFYVPASILDIWSVNTVSKCWHSLMEHILMELGTTEIMHTNSVVYIPNTNSSVLCTEGMELAVTQTWKSCCSSTKAVWCDVCPDGNDEDKHFQEVKNIQQNIVSKQLTHKPFKSFSWILDLMM